MPADHLCSHCRIALRKPKQRYCPECHARYMRGWRIAQRFHMKHGRVKHRLAAWAAAAHRLLRAKPNASAGEFRAAMLAAERPRRSGNP